MLKISKKKLVLTKNFPVFGEAFFTSHTLNLASGVHKYFSIFPSYIIKPTNKRHKEQVMKKPYSFLSQAFIFAVIMLLANGIVYISPVPLPASVVGMVLLFIALCTKIVKLDQVDALGDSLSKVIAFLFVPSGISLINSLDIMAKHGLEIIFVILVATIALLAATGWSAGLLLDLRKKRKSRQHSDNPRETAATTHHSHV